MQGVGFRPFVYRLARQFELSGWVANTGEGVTIEAEGERDALDDFATTLRAAPPAGARVDRVAIAPLGNLGTCDFEVRRSLLDGARTVGAPPDLATCAECLAELHEPSNRRYRYPFITCSACGPRYSIMLDLPYDRARTVMRQFTMCAACQAEYGDPECRRFHAETTACPECGPKLALWDAAGRVLGQRGQALEAVATALCDGAIVAIKGLGGFQLLVDAGNNSATARLRERKRRPDKPLALMVATLDAAASVCVVSEAEAAALSAPEAPIVLLRRRATADVCPAVAPDIAWLGVMLPTTPLHHLLLRSVGFPVVATSANVADEPILSDEAEARDRLNGIADLFLVHDRPIPRPVDDSVVRIVAGRPLMLRRARGYAPAVVAPLATGPRILAVGGQQKATLALTVGGKGLLGPHLGDLDTTRARDRHASSATEIVRLHGVKLDAVACDLHPDYASTGFAESTGLPLIRVQHHVAHAAACMAEYGLEGPVLAIAWDGTGLGADGSIWGGEFLHIHCGSYRRVGHLRCFRLPGGDAAIREPRRAALGLLFEMLGSDAVAREDLPPIASFTPAERRVLQRQVETGLNAPRTSSAGRLIDAVAALLGLRQTVSYEGQAAIVMESMAADGHAGASYCLEPCPAGSFGSTAGTVLDWQPAISRLLGDLARGVGPGEMISRFYGGLVAGMVAVARQVGERRVVLSGGCFQNAALTERALGALRGAGFAPYRHEKVPPNDGGLALGQLAWATWLARGEAG